MMFETFDDFLKAWGWPALDSFLIRIKRVDEELGQYWILFIVQMTDQAEQVHLVFIKTATSPQIQSWIDKSFNVIKDTLGK